MQSYRIGALIMGLWGCLLLSPETHAFPPLSGITEVAVGGDDPGSHSCALNGSNGTVWCWGRNYYGQVGNPLYFGDNTLPLKFISLPLMVEGLAGAQSLTIGAGDQHTCAVGSNPLSPDSSRTVCWGYNNNGELGNNNNNSRPYPVITQMRAGFDSALALALGRYHTCALSLNLEVWCWGQDQSGQLGDNCRNGNTCNNSRYIPVRVTIPSVSTVAAIAAGTYHTCAVMADGTVFCWGQQSDTGKLGNSSVQLAPNAFSDVPLQVMEGASPLGNVSAIAAGNEHTCVILNTGDVKCWGSNKNSQLGIVSDQNPHLTPLSINLNGQKTRIGRGQIAAGQGHTCVVVTANPAADKVLCWGRNTSGELGRGSVNVLNPQTPDFVLDFDINNNPPIAGATMVSSHYEHTCAVVNGGVKCWGSNNVGQIGNGSGGSNQVVTRATSVLVDQIFADNFESPQVN